MAEEPTNQEPIVQEPTQKVDEPTTDEIDVDALMGELNTIGKTTPESIKGMHTASKEAGNLARLLGEANKKIDNLQSQINQPQRSNTNYDYDEPKST